jgi:hypothetical protein
MKNLHKNPAPPAWRRGIILLALLLFAGCPTDIPPEGANKTNTPVAGGSSPDKPVEDHSPPPAITAFIIAGVEGIIDEQASPKTITLTLPHGTSLANLAPAIALSDGATVSPGSGVAQDFTNSIDIAKTYTVTAENGRQEKYRVTVQTRTKNSFALALDRELKFSAASVSISKTGSASVSVPTGYDSCQWSMDGKPAGAGGRTITLRGEDYVVGSHYLGATAWQNGIPYHGELVVTITP